MTLDELEERFKVFEDIEAIKKLKASYAYFIDTKNPEKAGAMFTDDAVADCGPYGRHEGRIEITKFFKAFPESYSFYMHMLHNPIIEVKGHEATGQWYFEVPSTNVRENRAIWQSGKYEEEYVKVEGEWKIKKMVVRIYYITPYDEGWAKTKMYE